MNPAYQLQRRLQEKCLGNKFWHSYSKKRVVLTNGRRATIDELAVRKYSA